MFTQAQGLRGNAIYITSSSSGTILVSKYDLNLVSQWSYSEVITGTVLSGNIDVQADGSVYLTGMGPASVIFGAGNNGSACFISKIDLFGNMLWRKGMNGAAPSITPELTGYYLDAATVLPVVRAGIDGKVYVVAAPGISIRTVSEDGDFENVKSIPVYQGSAYYQGMFFDPAGKMGIYGSTNGKITSGNGSYGLLDWFYLESDNL